MDCQQCGVRPAAIHLTQIVDNEVKTLHLCETCASEKGVQTEATVAKFPLSDFLASMGKGAASALPAGADGEACAFCGGTLQDFRDTGRLGCPRCYDTFEPHLRTLLRRIHGSSRHVGTTDRATEWGAGGAAADPGEETLAVLRGRLKRAVAAENFELAAELRDQIRAIE